jgi:hypothetical protein
MLLAHRRFKENRAGTGMKTTTGRVLALVLVGHVLGDAVRGATFAQAPQVQQRDGKIAIAFTVTAPTDVEVGVLDGGGKVVRHLAAGVLGGKNPPPAPLVGGLAQDVVWDGKDDCGRQATAAKIRIRAGMKAGQIQSHVLPNMKLEKKVGSADEPVKKKASKRKGKDQEGEEQKIPPLELRGLQKLVILDPIYCNGFAASAMLCGDPESGLAFIRHGSFWHGWQKMDVSAKKATALEEFDSVVCDLQFDADGNIFTFHWGQIRKWNRTWKPLGFTALKRDFIEIPPRFPSFNTNRHDATMAAFGEEVGPISRCVGLDNKLYQVLDLPASSALRVRVWKADGSLEKEGVVPFGPLRHASNVRVDAAGRIYLVVCGMPSDYRYSEKEKALKDGSAFRGTLVRIVPGNWMDKPGAVKSGLTLKYRGAEDWLPMRREPGKIAQARWGTMDLKPAEVTIAKPDLAVPGVSWVAPTPECTCSCLYFDLDRYGRIYLPDPALRRVRVLDPSGNEILDVAERSGDTEVLWPLRLFAYENGFVYWDGIAETINKQEFGWTAVETCSLP